MKKLFMLLFVCLFIGTVFAADVKNPLAFSGNIYTGLRADISEDSQTLYAHENANGTPIWANMRLDYSLDGNAGATINFRVKGTDVVSKNQSTFYPFLNRGFVWVKSGTGMFKARSGYLWDLDFETNGSAWDTASTYAWTTELMAFPAKNFQIGMVIPTPYNKMDLADAVKDVTYGFVYSPDNFRFSAMGEYGSVDANRSVNFGIDYTGIEKLTVRFEGDLQQVGISDVGYYNIGQAVNYVIGSFTPSFSVYEVYYKNGDPTKINTTMSGTIVDEEFTYFGEFVYNFILDEMDNSYQQLKLTAQKKVNAKAYIKAGTILNKASAEANIVVSPFVELFASF